MSNELSGDTARSSAIPVPMFPDIRGDNVPPATEVSPAQCPQGQSHRHQGEDVIDLDCPPSVPAAVLTPNPTTTTAAISTSADPNEQTPSATSAVGEDEDDGCRCDGQADDTGLPTPNTAAAMEVCEYVLTDRGELMQDCFLQEVEVGVEEGLHDGSEDSWESVHFHLDTDAGSGAGVDANGGTLSDPLPAAGMQFLDISDDLSGVYASIAAFRECGLSTAKCRGDGGDDDLQDWTFHMGSSESPSNQQNQQQPQPGQPNSQHSSSDGRNTPDPSFSFSSAGSASSTGSGSGSDHSRHSRGGKRGQRKGGGKGLGQRRRIQQQQQQHQDQHQYQGQQQCKGLGLDGTVAEENVPKWERKREVRQQKREQIRQERRRHRQAERKRADSAASATSTAEAETGTAGARAEARTKAGAGASAGEPLASGEGFWNSESLPSSQDYDDRSLDAYFESECRTPCACAFGDDDARLYTQHKIAATERQIDHLQKRIYRLQMRELLERQKLQEHEEHDWDEEIHFSVPQCTGGPHRRSRSLSRSHSRSRAQSPRGTDAGAPCDTLAQFPHRRPESSRRSEFGSHNTGCSVGAGVGRGSGSSRLDVRQGQDQGFTVDQPPLPGKLHDKLYMLNTC